jgi:alcohol dehydrogenase
MMVTNFKEISQYLTSKKYNKIFLITGKKSYYESEANKIFDEILKDKTHFKYFKKEFIPKFEELKAIILSVKEFSPDLILAIGGGTVIDYAKIANCLPYKTSKQEIVSGSLNLKKRADLCVIPTTAGSGAEVTENAVIYLDDIKYSVEHKLIKPGRCFLVPEFIIGSSKKLKASSGFDAIAQALESIISVRSNEESLKFSTESLKYSLNNFENYIHSPNFENTNKMCLAANLSGKAISIARTTAPHAISYPFTSIFNISHGHAVSLTLSKFLEFNYKNMNIAKDSFKLKTNFDVIFKISKTKSIEELSKYIEFLKRKANLESNFKKLNIDLNNDYEKIISGVSLQRLKNNPVEISYENIKNILNELNNN